MGGQCIVCDQGTTRAAGDDPNDHATGATSCECLEDEYVAYDAVSKTLSCALCADGRTNVAGDDPDDLDTGATSCK